MLTTYKLLITIYILCCLLQNYLQNSKATASRIEKKTNTNSIAITTFHQEQLNHFLNHNENVNGIEKALNNQKAKKSKRLLSSAEFLVNTEINLGQTYPSVAVFSDGSFVITWQSDGQDGDYLGIYSKRFSSPGVAIGIEFRVNTYTASYQSYPSVAVLTNENFVFTWHSPQDDGNTNDGV